MPKPTRIAAVALILFHAWGCGMMLNGRTQKVLIDSTPTGSVVEVDGVKYTTPARPALRRCQVHSVGATNDNGALVWRVIRSRTEWTSQILNLLILPIILNIADAIAGASCELYPESINIPVPPPDAGPELRSIEQ